jgi:CheY-like chemotaxis protein
MATKPLILAIEPDRRQASCLSSVARRISVELRLVESVAEALTALQGQLPHLILTPTLLPCRDDTMLTERLRELGDAAMHIQRLTTPLLEADAPRRGRILPKLRRGKAPATGVVGCTAETFAEQLAIYLEGAVAAHRARRRRRKSGPVETAATAAPPAHEDPPPVMLAATDAELAWRPASAGPEPATALSMLPPLPTVSVRVDPGTSAVDALPHVPEAVCSVDALMTALSSTTVGDTFVPTPPLALPAVAEIPAIRASGKTGVLASDAAGSALVPAPPTLPLEAAALPAITATSADGLSCVPEPIGPCELKALELVPPPPQASPTAGAGRKPRPVTQTAVVTPNGRQRRKMMRQMRATDWTA